MHTIRLISSFLISIIVVFIMTGCASQAKYYKSSVVDYLYPKESKIEVPTVTTLTLPVKVGIAFVPEKTAQSGMMNQSALTEKEKNDLLKRIESHFEKYDFLQSIEVIPSTYLSANGSFTNLDQIKAMYGVDVIALVSYDQAQFTDEDKASLSYWTLVGAYFIKGEKNDTHTMIETAVFDIKSRKMLFQATGSSLIKSNATPINLTEQTRIDSAKGLNEAGDILIKNLDEQLNNFRVKLKKYPDDFKVINKAVK